MWKLRTVKIENIISFREAEFEIKEGVATLIFGMNLDNASQPRNGSGKSSLVEAIAFGLTGEPMREKVTVDEIINDTCDEAGIGLRLENDYDGTVFTIERRLSRKSPQTIECHKYDAEGTEIETDKTVQATVADYNRFILDEIGLSKDDIYSHYILSDDKYRSFFRCPDKDKKEMINRFSNGYMVDESIERVKRDMEPVEKELNAINTEMSAINGSISALEAQLAGASEKTAAAHEEHERMLLSYDEKIAECRRSIRQAREDRNMLSIRRAELEECILKVEEAEDGELAFDDAHALIEEICEKHNISGMTDYKALLKDCNDKIVELREEASRCKIRLEAAEKEKEECATAFRNLNDTYKAEYQDHNAQTASENELRKTMENEIAKYDTQLDHIEVELKKRKASRDASERKLKELNNVLHGAVTCPKCHARFFVDESRDVEDVVKECKALEASISRDENTIKSLDETFDNVDLKAQALSDKIKSADKANRLRAERLNALYDELRASKGKLDKVEGDIMAIRRDMVRTDNETERCTGRIDVMCNKMLGEFRSIVGNMISQCARRIKQNDSDIAYLNGQTVQYERCKEELSRKGVADFARTIRESIDEYKKKLADADVRRRDVGGKHDMLKNQEACFVMFKSYLANKKIAAFSAVLNGFLEKIGSDIRICLEGFTMTKSGKLRDKIYVSVMRDGINCGSFYKRSGGEKARINLACILALHALTNADCEAGKGLDFIVIDEILDKSDEVGIATYCDALNALGQTTLMITQGSVVEGYEHKVVVKKECGISKISQ